MVLAHPVRKETILTLQQNQLKIPPISNRVKHASKIHSTLNLARSSDRLVVANNLVKRILAVRQITLNQPCG